MFSNRDAMLRAADHIEQHPKRYSFSETMIPGSEGGLGCLLGWMAHFSGYSGCLDSMIIHAVTGLPVEESDVCSNTFFQRLDELDHSLFASRWRSDSGHAAKILRRYVRFYLPLFHVFEAVSEAVPVWAQMRDREAQARIDAQPAYEKFRKGLRLEHVPEAPPGNSVPSNEPAEDDEVL